MRRHKHNLSHYRLLTAGMGKLLPIGCLEVLPGDTFRHSTSMLMRVSPLLAPVMHRVDVRIHHFFVPNRLIATSQPDWEEFITGQSETYPFGKIDPPATKGSLGDYLGIGLSGDGSVPVSDAALKAYDLIWYEFYRDQDLQDGPTWSVSSYDDEPLPVSWHKDYFTASRPWPQKGDPVTVPIGEVADLMPSGQSVQTSYDYVGEGIKKGLGHDFSGSGESVIELNPEITTGGNAVNWDFEEMAKGMQVDLTTATSAQVRDVRLAFALQRYQEARARYGSRYTEYLRYLGVNSSDARLQRPEYLGGGKQTISFSEVLQTAEGTDPVGEMRGHGIASLRSNKYQRFFEEHGLVISLLSVVPRNVYQDSTPRHFFKDTKEDWYQRELQDIGHQEVYTQELFNKVAGETTTFGYSPRYSEYFNQPSQVSGDFRDTLDYWHMARQFESAPVLNPSFIVCSPEQRNTADATGDILWIACQHQIGARRLVRKSNVGRII